MNQLVYVWACESDSADIWNLYYQDETNGNLYLRAKRTSISDSGSNPSSSGRNPSSGDAGSGESESEDYSATVILIGNDFYWNNHPEIIASTLVQLDLIPTVVVLGYVNFENGTVPFHFSSRTPWGLSREQRRAEYQQWFPNSSTHYLWLPDEVLARNCAADFMDCKRRGNHDGHAHHQCIPGPIARQAEWLIDNIVNTFSRDVVAASRQSGCSYLPLGTTTDVIPRVQY